MSNKPEAMYWISNGMLSVARHYGGCKFNGAHYTYFPKQDCLIKTGTSKNRIKEILSEVDAMTPSAAPSGK